MTVKSTIKHSLIPQKDFPKLRKRKDGELVILFSAPTTGMVVHADNVSRNEVGQIRTNWNNDLFEDFHGEVTLRDGS